MLILSDALDVATQGMQFTPDLFAFSMCIATQGFICRDLRVFSPKRRKGSAEYKDIDAVDQINFIVTTLLFSPAREVIESNTIRKTFYDREFDIKTGKINVNDITNKSVILKSLQTNIPNLFNINVKNVSTNIGIKVIEIKRKNK